MASIKGNIRVLGFSVDDYERVSLDRMTDRQLNEMALDDEGCVIYDTLFDFQGALNDDLVDTENMFWYFIVSD